MLTALVAYIAGVFIISAWCEFSRVDDYLLAALVWPVVVLFLIVLAPALLGIVVGASLRGIRE